MKTTVLFILIISEFYQTFVVSVNDAETPFPSRNLTYSILNESKNLSPTDTFAAFRYAFNQWTAVIPRDFFEIPFNPKKPANIRISFETGLTDEMFQNTTLIGYSFPTGAMYFNDDLKFKRYSVGEIKDPEINDFKWIAMHTIGHLLGLEHSFKHKSIMQASDVSTSDSDGRYIEPKLVISDIENIQDIYGPKNS